MKKRTGFTLIELLVVVAIISLLAAIVMTSTSSVRAKSRDARRLEDLQQIRIALEMYINDRGNYPAYGDSTTYYYIKDNNYYPNFAASCNTANWGLQGYLSNLCNYKDPQNNNYAYSINSSGQYKLGATFELTKNQGPIFTFNNGNNSVSGYYEPK